MMFKEADPLFQVLEYYPTPWNTWVKIGNLPAGRALHAVVPIGPQHVACVAGDVNNIVS